MQNIMDIARSSITAYRAALTVTGENIANVNTEGYRRRDVTTSEIGGGQTTPTTHATGGQGVEVRLIRRAFDALVADRLRVATSDMESATVQQDTAKAVEALILPNSGGLDASLDDFFSSLSSLAASPADTALRRVVLEDGKALAQDFADIAAGMMRLRDDIGAEVDTAVNQITADLNELVTVQARFSGVEGTVGALNPLHDERDRLLADLSEKVAISVEYDEIGRAQVRLGSDGGPILLGFDGAASVSAVTENDLTLKITLNGTERQTRLLESGALAGYQAALSGIDAAVEELDALARKIGQEFNAVHHSGLDLTGQPGGDLFALEGWTVTPAAGNQGYTRAVVTATGADQTGPLTLVHDGATGLWRAEDASGTVLGSAASLLVLPGVTIEFDGEPQDGDRISLNPTSGKAANMRFLLDEPGSFAAAAATLVSAAAGNKGAAVATMAATTVAPPALTDLADVLTNGAGAASGVSLLSSGVVGMIPAGTQSVTLAAMGLQSSADLSVPSGQLADMSTLSLTVGASSYSFDLTTLADGSARPSGWTMAELADALNSGAILNTAGDSLHSIGLSAAGAGGELTFAAASGNFTAASITGPGLSATGVLTAGAAQGGTIQIFTREGRQISGTPMSAAEAALLFTEANGFLPGATYVTDYLNGTDGTGYRGLSIDTVAGAGQQAISLATNSPATWSGTTEAAASPAHLVQIETAGALPVTLTLPQGSTAARLAQMIGDAIPGLTASAETAVELTAASDGRVTFNIAGDNSTPILVSGDVVGGRLDALAMSVNALTGATGITAELSPEGDRLLLRHGTGQDIRISSLSHSGGGTVNLQPAAGDGSAVGGAVTLGAGLDGARISGQVSLHQDLGFSVELDGARQDSAADAYFGGLVTRSTAQAGAATTLTFGFDAGFDGASAATDGFGAAAGATDYTVALGGRSFTLSSGQVGATSADDIATAMAALMRTDMPQASLTGAAVAALPSDGATATVRVDGQDYLLRMTGGAVTVSGPEEGRLSASFGADMRLNLTVNGGSTDGGMISLPTGTAGTAWGLSSAQAPVGKLTGQPVDTGALPATIKLEIGGTLHTIGVSAGPSITLPGGFPGTATINGSGAIELEIPAFAGAVRVLPGAEAAGFDSLGATLSVDGDALNIAAADGAALPVSAQTSSAVGQRVSLSNLPAEDLIVVMTGSGNLRLAGSMVAGDPPTTPASVELRVLDAATRRVELVDLATGHSIGTRVLDSQGSTVVGGLAVHLTGNAATGDAYRLTANSNGRNDGRVIDNLLALQSADAQTGKGGFARILADLQSEIGTRAAAADQKVTSTTAVHDTVRRADAEKGAVDLDTEAAKMLEYQQAYQASAQIMSVVKTIFETLLNSI